MHKESMKPTFAEVADKLSTGPLPLAIGEVALAAATFAIPPKELPCRAIRHEYKVGHIAPNVMQPDIEETVAETRHILDTSVAIPSPLLDNVQLTRFIGTMLQFSDRTPTIRAAMMTPYADVAKIYDYTIETARDDGPVTYAQHLEFALEQTNDIPTALWNLFLTSRQYARWRDTGSIVDFPEYTTRGKLNRMRLWYQSVAACKQPDKNGYQDVAGDAYYVWTHALARTIYDGLPAQKSPLSEFYTAAFAQGSRIMSVSHKLGAISVLGTLSDHVPAAAYGNAIGQLCADKVKTLHVNASTEPAT